MKTLKDFTEAIIEAGCYRPKMERSYKRRDHREALVRCHHEWRMQGKVMKAKEYEAEGKATLDYIVHRLTAAGFEITYDSWNYNAYVYDIEIWLQAKVALAEGF